MRKPTLKGFRKATMGTRPREGTKSVVQGPLWQCADQAPYRRFQLLSALRTSSWNADGPWSATQISSQNVHPCIGPTAPSSLPYVAQLLVAIQHRNQTQPIQKPKSFFEEECNGDAQPHSIHQKSDREVWRKRPQRRRKAPHCQARCTHPHNRTCLQTSTIHRNSN